jgi:hypothetical protein
MSGALKGSPAPLAGLISVGVLFLRELEAGTESCQLGCAILVVLSLGIANQPRRANRRHQQSS